jgi:glycosyltransferase involved in cell wall biosynthesis
VTEVLVDVMLPAYGDGSLVREAIGTVLSQDDPQWRLTVVDDGISDDLGGRLESWLRRLGDSRIRYIANRQRLGINRNFQRCVDEARADLVVILGSDDRLLPDFVRRLREAAIQFPKAAWIHTGARVIDDHGEPTFPLADRMKRLTALRVQTYRLAGGEELAASLLHGNWMYFPSVAFRRDVLQRHGFRQGYDIVLDLDIYLRILLDGGSALLFECPGIEYRRHSTSLSSAQAASGTRFDEELAYFREAVETMAAAGWLTASRAAGWHWTSRLHAAIKVPGLLAAGQFTVAARMVLLSLAASSTRSAPSR